MQYKAYLLALCLAVAGVGLLADEGMWRFDQLPVDVIAKTYGVTLQKSDLDRLQAAPVRIVSPSSGGTGTFASANGLILTNHHVALDCIRTSTLAEQAKANAENLIENGFTASSPANELPCRRFRAQIERISRDVTSELEAAVKPGMDIVQIQRARLAARSDIERACQKERGPDFACAVIDFNSGARSMLVVHEEYKDVRLVYAPEKQLGYYGGDEMNFRFPRYVSDISILRAYQGKDGSRGDFEASHVPSRPSAFLRVTFDGVRDGDFTLVAGFPGTTNRYRESLSASYNLRKGIPDQIRDLEEELALLRKHAAVDPKAQVILQARIFGLANSLKYQQDVLAALKATNVVDERLRREKEFMAFLGTKPELKAEYGSVIADQTEVYANDVEANADLNSALGWLQRSSVLGYASGLYQFAQARAKPNDRDREPQFQERNWTDVRQALLDDEPIVQGLEEDVLTAGFTRALALPAARQIPAVRTLATRVGAGRAAPASPRELARAVLQGSRMGIVDGRKGLTEAPLADLEASTDPAVMFARDLEPSLGESRERTRVLNEKILRNRSRFARGIQAWKGSTIYPDANFTLRVTYGKVASLTKPPVTFATRFGEMFALAERRGNKGDFALPPKLLEWRKKVGDAVFKAKYADMPVNFISTNDITGGNSGSSTLNRRLEIVGLIFDGNEGSMASDWSYNGSTGRALSTDVRFALTIAREIHGAGWIVDELMK
jgi:hypothetical protein